MRVSADQLRERMAYPVEATRSMMMVVIAAVVMVVAMSMIASGSVVLVRMAHGMDGVKRDAFTIRHLRIREYMQLTI
jgi:hypothetical protein